MVGCLVLLAGCGSKHYRASADKEVYRILAHKQKAALDSDAPFSIEPDAWDPLEELPRRAQPLLPREAIELLPELAEVEPIPMAPSFTPAPSLPTPSFNPGE